MRRPITLSLFLVLLFAAYLATNGPYWIHWLTLAIFILMLYVTDLLFLNRGDMDFDPFYASYAKKTDPAYFSTRIG